MLYTLAEAAKATGLGESTIFRAIEDGQITGTKDLSGEWHVEDEELHRLYLSIARHYCKRKWRAGIRRSDGTTLEPEIATIVTDAGSSVRQQHIDDLGDSFTAANQAETGLSTPATASTWDDDIRVDDRDKISVSDSRLGSQRT